jgi:phage-related protein
MEQERFKVNFFVKNGKCPPVDFMADMDREARLKAHEYIEMLKIFGNNLRQPYSKKVSGIKGLFELCVEYNNNEFRLFYFFRPGKEAVIVHAIQKKSQKTKQNDLLTAVERMKELKGENK